ncbi:MAG: A/G-specific adenine glycosylase [Arsenophonus sp.]|nr:MAG: A/G-specific adenine glycosylase [Arsenophonus sp.]
MNNLVFSSLIIEWYTKYGRKYLPWQIENNDYYVWVSEIMLQQTQVKTVIPYFKKFISFCPNVISVANKNINEIYYLWNGLGYYNRAKNLYNAAKKILNVYNGIFPNSFDEIIKLPGIGRSTAGAILSLSRNQCFPILDGNVKRILSRYYGIYEYINKKKTENKLWNLMNQIISKKYPRKFNQGMMDLGSQICTYRNPKCYICPLNKKCYAFINNTFNELPNKKIIRIKLNKKIWIVILEKNNNFWLEKRLNTGILSNLYSFPEFTSLHKLYQWLKKKEINKVSLKEIKSFQHYLSHINLNIFPIYCSINENIIKLDKKKGIWYNKKQDIKVGIPTIVKKILNLLNN